MFGGMHPSPRRLVEVRKMLTGGDSADQNAQLLQGTSPVKGSNGALRRQVHALATSRATPAILYSLAVDSSSYPIWSMIGSYALVRAGASGPMGVGHRRRFRTGLVSLVEEVVELVPDRLVRYILIEGLPLRDYRAEIHFSPAGGGVTKICWKAAFVPEFAGTGWLCGRLMSAVLGSLAKSLALAGEKGPLSANVPDAAA